MTAELSRVEWAAGVAAVAATLTVEVRKVSVRGRKAPAWVLTYEVDGAPLDDDDTFNLAPGRFDTRKAAVAAAAEGDWKSRFADLVPFEDYWVLLDERHRGGDPVDGWRLLLAVERAARGGNTMSVCPDAAEIEERLVFVDRILDRLDEHGLDGYVVGFDPRCRYALVVVGDAVTIAHFRTVNGFGRWECSRRHLDDHGGLYAERFPITPTRLDSLSHSVLH